MRRKARVVLIVILFTFCGLATRPGQWIYKEAKRIARPITKPLKAYLLHPLLSETQDTREIVTLLKVYQAYEGEEPIKLKRIGRPHDGGYVIPETAIKKADAILGYGIADDISFEESASALYGKPSWGFDGTCTAVSPKHELCHFIPLCIGSVENKERYSTFNQQMDMLDLKHKKLFIKMDIEGGEYDALPDVLQHSQNITGIVLEIHFCDKPGIVQALNLLKMLNENFLLLHVHGNNICQDYFTTQNSLGKLTRVLELTYINKKYVDGYSIALDQTHPTPLDLPNAPDVPDVHFSIRSLSKPAFKEK